MPRILGLTTAVAPAESVRSPTAVGARRLHFDDAGDLAELEVLLGHTGGRSTTGGRVAKLGTLPPDS